MSKRKREKIKIFALILNAVIVFLKMCWRFCKKRSHLRGELIGLASLILAIILSLSYPSTDDLMRNQKTNKDDFSQKQEATNQRLEDIAKNIDTEIFCNDLSLYELRGLTLKDDTIFLKDERLAGNIQMEGSLDISQTRKRIFLSSVPELPEGSAYYFLIRDTAGNEVSEFEIYNGRVDFRDHVNLGGDILDTQSFGKKLIPGAKSTQHVVIGVEESPLVKQLEFKFNMIYSEDEQMAFREKLFTPFLSIKGKDNLLFDLLSFEIGIKRNERHKDLSEKHQLQILRCSIKT